MRFPLASKINPIFWLIPHKVLRQNGLQYVIWYVIWWYDMSTVSAWRRLIHEALNCLWGRGGRSAKCINVLSLVSNKIDGTSRIHSKEWSKKILSMFMRLVGSYLDYFHIWFWTWDYHQPCFSECSLIKQNVRNLFLHIFCFISMLVNIDFAWCEEII